MTESPRESRSPRAGHGSWPIDPLAQRVERLEQRLDLLERRLSSGAVEGQGVALPSASPSDGDAEPLGASGLTHETLPLLGRTLVIFGGAFALRAITESGLVEQSLGTLLGFAYALLWLVLADRAAGKSRTASAGFHAAAAAGIGYPLLVEATLRFEYLSPMASALALIVITGHGLFVAARRNLRAVAWIFALALAGSSAALAIALRMPLLFGGTLLACAVPTLTLAYRRRWVGPAIVVAVIVDALVLLLGVTALVGDEARVRQLVDPLGLIALQLALVLVYLGAACGRAIVARKPLFRIEIAHAVVVLAVGLGGAAATTESTEVSHVPLGFVALLVALACYAAAFGYVDLDRAAAARRSFVFCTSCALVFMVVGVEVLFEPPWRETLLAGLALLAYLLGSARGRATLGLHGAVYLLAALAGSGLPDALVASFGSRAVLAPWVSLPVLLVLGVAAASASLPAPTRARTWSRGVARAPKVVALVVASLGGAGLAVALGASLFPHGEPGTAPFAVLRTAILAALAVGLSGLGRLPAMREASWVVYPLLALAGAKLLLEDLRTDRPLAMFASLALYGSALILAPRLNRARRTTVG